MRRTILKFAVFIASVALASPLLAQKTSPLVVEVLKPSTTVLKTGDELRQTYRVRFLDLSHRGKEVLVLTDRSQPENLVFAPFEALDLKIEKRKDGGEHVWDFTYTLRIIGKEKKEYAIPKIKFYWTIKDVGANEEDLKVNEFETEEVLIKYVSTITNEKYLDIRDKIDLGSFRAYAYAMKISAIAIALFWIIFAWTQFRCGLSAEGEASRKKKVNAEKEIMKGLSEVKSRMRGRQAEKAPQDLLLEMSRLTREIMFLELEERLRSNTASEILNFVEKLPRGRKKELLRSLAIKHENYETALLSGLAPTISASEDIEQIITVFQKIIFWRRLRWII